MSPVLSRKRKVVYSEDEEAGEPAFVEHTPPRQQLSGRRNRASSGYEVPTAQSTPADMRGQILGEMPAHNSRHHQDCRRCQEVVVQSMQRACPRLEAEPRRACNMQAQTVFTATSQLPPVCIHIQNPQRQTQMEQGPVTSQETQAIRERMTWFQRQRKAPRAPLKGLQKLTQQEFLPRTQQAVLLVLQQRTQSIASQCPTE